MPTTWDEHGNVITAPAPPQKQSWDENGNPIATKKPKSSIPYAPGQVSEAGGIPFVVPGPQTAGEMRTSAQDPEAAIKIKGGAETIGTMVGGEAIPAIRGLVGAALRVLGMGAGAGAGNIAGQVATTGKVDPREAGKATAAGAAFGAGSEVLGAGLSELRSSLSRLAYTSEGELTPLAKAITHPTELPETLFRKAIPEPAEQVAARETFAKTKQIAESQEAAANQQRILSNRARIDAARAAREAKASAPKPVPPSPFGNAIPTNVPIGTAKLSDLAGQPTPFAQPNVEMVNKFEAPAK